MGVVRIGGGQSAYGASPEPIEDQLAAGVDYVVCDALAEATLVVLQKDRQRDEALGYTRDLRDYVNTVLPSIRDGSTKLVTNAGGLNPFAASREVVRALKDAGVTGVKVGTVTGDDVLPWRDQLGLPDDALFARAYLGARPVVEALNQGADIVVTGRVADASLFLAPLVHEHGWAWDDWPRIGSGIIVGHLLECSAEVTGSVYSGPWWEDPMPERPAYPIAEVSEDGSAVITKPPHTGGMVNFDTVREQLLYEVHDPTAYLNPDCTADFTSLCVEDLGGDRVRVSGLRAGPPPQTYKTLVARPAGWTCDVVRIHSWPDAESRARSGWAVFRRRVEERGLRVEEWYEEIFGVGALHGDAAREDLRRAHEAGWEPPEVVARLAWRCKDAATAEAVKACGGRGGQGTGGMGTSIGKPKRRGPSQLISLHASTVERSLVDSGIQVTVEDV